MDGSQKIPQRWLATMIERDGAGQSSPAHMFSLASWAAYTGGHSGAYTVDDPLADRLRHLWDLAAGDVDRLTDLFVDKSGVFPAAFGASARLRRAFAVALRMVLERGARPALEAFVAQHDDP